MIVYIEPVWGRAWDLLVLQAQSCAPSFGTIVSSATDPSHGTRDGKHALTEARFLAAV